jgi:hypothetical protein
VPDSLLILAPLLVLAVILVLGFAGCGFEVRVGGGADLTFRVRVPTNLEVLPPAGGAPAGVRFLWQRPSGTTEGQADVTAFVDDGAGNNVYSFDIPDLPGEDEPEPGGWLGRCQMTVRADGQTADAVSNQGQNYAFEVPDDSQDHVLLFVASGSPLTPQDPFKIDRPTLDPP